MEKANEIDISVIIPVYNVAEYLPACVDSVMHQDGLRLEIILINDGSTDRSGMIAEQYAEKDNRIKVINKENGGASSARNMGLKLAKGEYIAFVDSDDRITENALYKLFEEAVNYQSDVVMGASLYTSQDIIIDHPYNPIPKDMLRIPLGGKECFIRLVKSNAYIPMVWNYLYRRKYLEKIQACFEEGIIHEDELWSPVTLCNAQKIVAVDIDFYYYRQREDSVMQSTRLHRRLESLFRVNERLMEYADCFEFSGEDRELKSWLYVIIFRNYHVAFRLLSQIKDTSCNVPNHYLDRFWRDCHKMIPEPQKICQNYFRHAEDNLKKHIDWRMSDWVASVASQLNAGKKLMLIYNVLPDNDLTIKMEDVPDGWLITTDRYYLHQADAVVFHLPNLYQTLDNELEKPERQVWISWYLESEKQAQWIDDPELRELFDSWICYRLEDEQQDHPIVQLCRQLDGNCRNTVEQAGLSACASTLADSAPKKTPSGAFFSVIMPTYNQSAFIKRAILSLFQQTYQHWELVIINDGCTDETEKRIAGFLSDERITYIKNEVNRGLGYAINQGLNLAKYDHIAYLPSDDFYYENHLQLLMEKFDESENAVMTISGINMLDQDSTTSSGNYFSLQNPGGYPAQLVQTAHRKTDDRWIERTEFDSDDLSALFWHKLTDKGITAFTGQVTAHWTLHPHQRHKIMVETDRDGGVNYYRSYYQVRQPVRLRCRNNIPVDEESIYARFRKPANLPKSNDRLKILLAGELTYSPERIIAFEEHGHQLYGLWPDGPVYSFNNIGPFPFGHVTDIPNRNWKETVRQIRPDIIYALQHSKAIPLAHEVLMNNRDIPFVWQFKEGPPISMRDGLWSKLIDLYSYSDGQIYINPEAQEWYGQFILTENQMTFILDGDMPKIDYFTHDFSPLLSETDGEIHTVAPGRTVGISFEDLQELAIQKIHLHLYVLNFPQSRDRFISMAREAMGNRFHLHPPCMPCDWVREFSRYDAGWLHCFRSKNNGRIIKAGWDDLNLPARMNTLAAAGVPMIQYNNNGHIVAMQSKISALNAGVFFNSYRHLGSLLRNREYMQTLRNNVLEHRKLFAFDYHVPALIDFFRSVIDRKRRNV